MLHGPEGAVGIRSASPDAKRVRHAEQGRSECDAPVARHRPRCYSDVMAVIDTNVLFEGLTKLGACSLIIDAWVDRLFIPCVSTALAYEYEEVLTNKLRPERSGRALLALQALSSGAA